MKKTIGRIALTLVLMVAVASMTYAGSALQLFESYGVQYVKHVNYNSATSSKTWLLIENGYVGTARVQIKFAARAVDGTTVSGGTFIYLNPGQTKSVWLYHRKPITDLNFLQLIGSAVQNPG